MSIFYPLIFYNTIDLPVRNRNYSDSLEKHLSYLRRQVSILRRARVDSRLHGNDG